MPIWVPPSSGGGSVEEAPRLDGPLLTDTVPAGTSSHAVITTTASATPYTPGAWVEIDPSLSQDAAGLAMHNPLSNNTSGFDSSALLQIGTGGAGAETVWATAGVGFLHEWQHWVLPGFIAAGTRVSARLIAAEASKAIQTGIQFLSVSGTAPGAPVTLGVDEGSARGLVLPLPGAVNTEGDWWTLAESTGQALTSLAVFPGAGSDTTWGAGRGLIDIGVGAEGFEQVIIPNVEIAMTSSESMRLVTPTTFAVDIPAGSRVVARRQQDSASNVIDVFVVGA